MGASEATTEGIRVSVDSEFLADRSDPAARRWMFGYTISISNESDSMVQLLDRHWVITDAEGRIEEVRGPGVVGKQPAIKPGTTFRYQSFCPLDTSFGTMEGSFGMTREDGTSFQAKVGAFLLHEPYAVN